MCSNDVNTHLNHKIGPEHNHKKGAPLEIHLLCDSEGIVMQSEELGLSYKKMSNVSIALDKMHIGLIKVSL